VHAGNSTLLAGVTPSLAASSAVSAAAACGQHQKSSTSAATPRRRNVDNCVVLAGTGDVIRLLVDDKHDMTDRPASLELLSPTLVILKSIGKISTYSSIIMTHLRVLFMTHASASVPRV